MSTRICWAFASAAATLLCIAAAPAHSAPPASAATRPTFAKHVAPILYENCVSCHRTGEVAPFPLLTYGDAKKRAAVVAAVVAGRVMPPWKPRPGHGDFQDDCRLTGAQIETLKRWAGTGAVPGNLADLPPAPTFKTGWQLGPPDKILRLPERFAVPAEGPDVYQHFVFPLGEPRERYLRAIEIRPGNRRVAHHAIGILDKSGTARELDKKTPEPGYRGMGGGAGFLPAGFTPG